MSCSHEDTCEYCTKQKKGILELVMKLDSYLSLLRHRHIPRNTPDDLIRDVDRVLGQAHGFAKLGRMAD
jgi:hypothetical protein